MFAAVSLSTDLGIRFLTAVGRTEKEKPHHSPSSSFYIQQMQKCRSSSIPDRRSSRKPVAVTAAVSPSFSSSLLDSVYRSIDAGDNGRTDELQMKKKHTGHVSRGTIPASSPLGRPGGESDPVRTRRAAAVEKWMKPDFEKSSRRDREFPPFRSCSTSSASSSGGGFSSSEAESVRAPPPEHRHALPAEPGPFWKPKKSKAAKIYDEMKKVKQPVSPGAKLASFLNSLFVSGNSKKQRQKQQQNTRSSPPSSSSLRNREIPRSNHALSSLSRSCLSRTNGKVAAAGEKRSVKFYPFSVTVDEYSRPCGREKQYESKSNDALNVSSVRCRPNDEVENRIAENSRRAEKFGRDLQNGYQQKIINSDLPNLCVRRVELNAADVDDATDEDNQNDCCSCSSSDLFELDNLFVLGGGGGGGHRYHQEELPVYGTTRLDSNRAIAVDPFL